MIPATANRPIARLILTLALLVLGGFALARLPLEFLPRQSFPELTVGLDLGADRDPGDVTRDWVEPVESAVRSLGRVKGMAGEVRTDGGTLTVRFAPGVDPERKAARLDSELARLRARLPEGAALWVDPASDREGDLHAHVWLSGVRDDAGVRNVAETLRSVPGVRRVQEFGPRDEEVRIELAAGALDPWGLARRVLAEARRSLRVSSLGWSRRGDRLRPVVTAPLADLAHLPIPADGSAVALGSLAAVHARHQPARAVLRFRGEPARALFIWRAHDAAPLALDRALRERLARLPGGARGEIGWSEAAPLHSLVRRLLLAGLIASLLGALAGAWLAGRWGALALGLAPAAAVAAAANAFLLAGLDLNVTTLTALAVAATGLLPLAALRLVRGREGRAWAWTAVAAAATVRLAISLASAELGPRLAEPAQALLLAVASGVLAFFLLPLPPLPVREGGRGRERGPGGEGPARALGLVLRDPGTAALLAATLAFLSLALFGPALLPQPGPLEPDQGNLTAQLRLPQGTPLDETVRRAAKVEEVLGKSEDVERSWLLATPGTARVTAELKPSGRSLRSRQRLTARLRYEAGHAGSLEVFSGIRPPAGGGSFLDEMEERAGTDEEATAYRVILRGASLEAVRAGYDRLLQRLDTLKVRRHWVTGWGKPTLHLVLRPLPGASPADAAALAERLRRESTPPPSIPLAASRPGGARRSLTVVPAGAPEDSDRAVPQVAEILGRPLQLDGKVLTPASRLTLTEDALYPRVARQSGRFVVPVDVQILLSAADARKEMRKNVDRSLGQLPLPAGCDLERPTLGPDLWRRDRLRLIGLGLAVPLLLFAVAGCRLGSLPRGLAALAPLALGLVAALPLVAGGGLGRIDELTLFALAAALALALPSTAEAAASPDASGGRLYHALRRQAPWLLAAAPVLVLGLALPTLGAEPGASPWALPLRTAAVAGGTALAGSVFLTPALLLAGARWRNRDPEEERRRRHPPAWSEPGPPELEVRSLAKVYGGRFTALRGIDFTLNPGIVGLLGPNGAGKTTLLRILTGLLEPTRGSVRYRGVPLAAENLAEYRRRIGFLPQEFNAYPGFTAEQFLDHWARERGMTDARLRSEEIGRLLTAVGLSEHAGRKVRDFSGGMRQRVGIARALLGAPPILIVDEPTTGLDVESRNRFRQTLLEQAGERIVVFSTHIASDVEAAASRILLLHKGRLRFDGAPEELAARARGRVFGALVPDSELLDFGRQFRVTSRVRVLEGIQVRAIARPGEAPAGELVDPNLEEAYLAEIDRTDA